MTLGVDVGGTFTDVVRWDGAALTVAKTSSTPDQSDGVIAGARRLTGGDRDQLLVHGTTVATNALLERTGATVALATDAGFEHLIEIARQNRPSLYDHDVLRPAPLVDRRRRYSKVPGVVDADAIAVCLLGAFSDPGPERRLAAEIGRSHLGIDVVASTDVSGEFREYERLSTTVLTAYLRPVVRSYLERLEARVGAEVAERLLVMQSSGGLVGAGEAADHAASILLSGPAGGVVAAGAFGAALGHRAVISFDMGGTSTDVCRVEDGVPEVTYERAVEGYVCRLPSVAVHTVGAGGGSVGWRDPAGALRVGPRSAGAEPGPAAYGRGGREPTVTDADVILGRLGSDQPLADGLVLDPVAAGAALESVGPDATEVALGIVEIVEAHMERAIRRVSVEEGFDPARAALVAFGGAGAMHAVALAEQLGIETVLVPPHAGVLSALGLLLASPRVDEAQTILCDPGDAVRIGAAVGTTTERVSARFREALGVAADTVEVLVDLRYVGQAHETTVPHVPGEAAQAFTDRFHEAHHRRNGFSRIGDPVEVVTVRATAVGRPALTVDRLPEHRPHGPARVGDREVRTKDGVVDAALYRRTGLGPGTEIVGPAVVADLDCTVWVPPGSRAQVHPSGTLVIVRA